MITALSVKVFPDDSTCGVALERFGTVDENFIVRSKDGLVEMLSVLPRVDQMQEGVGLRGTTLAIYPSRKNGHSSPSRYNGSKCHDLVWPTSESIANADTLNSTPDQKPTETCVPVYHVTPTFVKLESCFLRWYVSHHIATYGTDVEHWFLWDRDDAPRYLPGPSAAAGHPAREAFSSSLVKFVVIHTKRSNRDPT
ncbi:hypothetical protein LY76DRAFT_636533 [Colletotrichum caudatum]|nr:hypothetical protein LY76DRAFT_636533 [Colletotrichum caudatum]